MTKFSPKRNNYFFFFQPKGFDYELYESLGISQWKYCTLSTYIFVPLMVSTFFPITFLFLESFLSQENNFVDFFYSRSECFFAFLTVLN